MLSQSPTPFAGFTLWFTGLPCAGKSTLASEIGVELRKRGHSIEILDGDVVRTTLCKGLGFSKEDRDENISRLGWVCNLLNSHGVVAIAAVVSPYREARNQLRRTIPRFIEIYVKAPPSVCMDRDVKGLYAKAIAGELSHFTGVDDPYEEPMAPDIIVETHDTSVAQCVSLIIKCLETIGTVRLGTASKSQPISVESCGSPFPE
jgi:adenylyl-sulfate kinase